MPTLKELRRILRRKEPTADRPTPDCAAYIWHYDEDGDTFNISIRRAGAMRQFVTTGAEARSVEDSGLGWEFLAERISVGIQSLVLTTIEDDVMTVKAANDVAQEIVEYARSTNARHVPEGYFTDVNLGPEAIIFTFVKTNAPESKTVVNIPFTAFSGRDSFADEVQRVLGQERNWKRQELLDIHGKYFFRPD